MVDGTYPLICLHSHHYFPLDLCPDEENRQARPHMAYLRSPEGNLGQIIAACQRKNHYSTQTVFHNF